jgi:predicted phosphoadenosine phosphosulfate sulfurtransferase
VATYGKQIGYRSFKLPPGHTWKSFVKFLLSTLPKEVADNFKLRFAQSLRFWARTGRGLHASIIAELKKHKIQFRLNGKTAHGSKLLDRVQIARIPDHLDMLSCHNSQVTSWKRFAITILKNDHVCKYMGLAPTHDQIKRQREIMEKYKKI